MKTLSTILIAGAVLLVSLAGTIAARADMPHRYWPHPYRHHARVDRRGHRLERRGMWLQNHGHPVVGGRMERHGARMVQRSNRWDRNHGVPGH